MRPSILRWVVPWMALGGVLVLLAAACGGTEVVEVTRVVREEVTKVVEEEVEVTRVVEQEVEVTRVVEQEVEREVTRVVEQEVTRVVEAELPRIHLRCNSIFATEEQLSDPLRVIKEELETRSNGRITVENFFNGALFRGGEEPDGLGGGVAECGTVTPAYYRGTYPVAADGVYLPFGLTDKMDADIANIPFISDVIREEFAETNVVPLLGSPAPQGFHFADPLPSNGAPADMTTVFDGLRVRGYSGWPDIIRAWGGAAVSFPSPEIPIALRQGQMSGFVTSWDTWWNLGVQYDTPHTYVHNPRLTAASIISMNKDTYDSFSPEVKTLVQETMVAVGEEALRRALEELDSILERAEADPDLTVHRLTEEETQRWIDAAQVFWDEFATRSTNHRLWIEALRKYQQEGYVASWER